MSCVLVTGGAGYLGTHAMVQLAEKGHQCICIDNYAHGSLDALYKAQTLVPDTIRAYDMDISDEHQLSWLLGTHKVDAVVHLAWLENADESSADNAELCRNNVSGSQFLLAALARARARNFVFCSSASVYGQSEQGPTAESATPDPVKPHAESKLEVEELVRKMALELGCRTTILRVFNTAGAHESGCIGETFKSTSSSLFSNLNRVAMGKVSKLEVFGDDYPTADGTPIRDYVHVLDVASAIVTALGVQEGMPPGSAFTLNIGSGMGHSVTKVVEAFERVNRVRVARRIVSRRPGDVSDSIADTSLANRVLGWKAARTLDDVCRDAWNWARLNPALV